MKKPNITPGPWAATATPSSEFAHRAINSDEGYRVATVGAPRDIKPHISEQTANAQAIAAVPDLLAALERLLACPDLQFDAMEPESLEAMADARAALTKAGYTF